MIESIKLFNFKCFREQLFSFGALTLFTGLNGMGKSSVIQSLLLMRQSGLDQNTLSHIILNGGLTHVGQSSDLLHQSAQNEIIQIETKFNGTSSLLRLETKDYTSDADVCPLLAVSLKPFQRESLFNNHFHFLSAERFGPRTSLPASEHLVRQRLEIGNSGELVGQFLLAFEKNTVASDYLKHPSEEDDSLIRQTEAWMSEICPTIRLDAKSHLDLGSVQIRYSFVRKNDETNHFRAQNVGFGISYSLPVVVALLTPFPQSLIIIENPEAHLHPAGQAALGRLIACSASAGNQVVIETHSDHILNGIRVAVMKEKLDPKNISTFFFSPDDDDIQPRVFAPQLNKKGRYDHWPEGFFDQWEKNLEELI